MTSRLSAITLALLFVSVELVTAQSGYDLFQQALVKERADANVAGAIRIYERIVKEFSSNRPLVAKTLLQLGSAYEKRQEKQQARAAYDRISKEFATEADAVTEARRRLAALDGAPATEGLTFRVVTTGNDADSGAWITRDGRFLARPDWDTGDLAIRDLVLSKPVRMMAKAGDWDNGEEKDAEVDEAMLSPDLKSIVYVWLPPGNDTNYQLRIMPNAVGGKPRILVDSPEYDYFVLGGWSADGGWILASLAKPDGTWVLAWISKDQKNVIRPLKSLGWRFWNDRPSISPDGRYVAYSAFAVDPGRRIPRYPPLSPEPDQHIYVLPADGLGQETLVVKGANVNESPLWTPDGTRLVFVSNRSGTGFGLWSVGVKDGKITDSPAPVQTTVAGRIRPISITDKGALYFVPEQQNGTGFDIFLAQIDASTLRATGPLVRLVDNFAERNRAPSWSPNGKAVAFMRQRVENFNPNDPNAFALFVYNTETGIEKEYRGTTYLDPAMPPVWSHDGKSLLVRRRYDGGQLNRVDPESGEFKSVTAMLHSRLPTGWQSVALSPDDSTLYFAARTPQQGASVWEIVSIDSATGEQKRLWTSETKLDGAMRFALSPDGRRVTMVLRRPGWTSPRLFRMNLDGSELTELAQGVSLATIAWDQSGIYYGTDAEQSQLMRVSPRNGKPESLGLANGEGPISVGGGGTSILYSKSTRGDNQLYVMENLMSLWKPAVGK
jgi:Tol biopolymer transport system component